MNHSLDTGEEPCAQPANDLSTSFAELLPAAPDEVAPFIRAVAAALGEAEADLARRLGISHATLSTWKRRGSIPDTHLEWFSSEFVRQIFRTDPQIIREGFHHRGLEIALAVFKRTDFDIFHICPGKDISKIENSFRLVSPISRLGLFVQSRLELSRGRERVDDHLWNHVVPKVVELAWLAVRSY